MHCRVVLLSAISMLFLCVNDTYSFLGVPKPKPVQRRSFTHTIENKLNKPIHVIRRDANKANKARSIDVEPNTTKTWQLNYCTKGPYEIYEMNPNGVRSGRATIYRHGNPCDAHAFRVEEGGPTGIQTKKI